MQTPRIDRIEATADETEFGAAMVAAAEALFTLGAARFTPERRESVRAALQAGVPLEVRVQLKPVPLVRVVLERDDGGDEELFSWVPVPVGVADDQRPALN